MTQGRVMDHSAATTAEKLQAASRRYAATLWTVAVLVAAVQAIVLLVVIPLGAIGADRYANRLDDTFAGMTMVTVVGLWLASAVLSTAMTIRQARLDAAQLGEPNLLRRWLLPDAMSILGYVATGGSIVAVVFSIVLGANGALVNPDDPLGVQSVLVIILLLLGPVVVLVMLVRAWLASWQDARRVRRHSDEAITPVRSRVFGRRIHDTVPEERAGRQRR